MVHAFSMACHMAVANALIWYKQSALFRHLQPHLQHCHAAKLATSLLAATPAEMKIATHAAAELTWMRTRRVPGWWPPTMLENLPCKGHDDPHTKSCKQTESQAHPNVLSAQTVLLRRKSTHLRAGSSSALAWWACGRRARSPCSPPCRAGAPLSRPAA